MPASQGSEYFDCVGNLIDKYFTIQLNDEESDQEISINSIGLFISFIGWVTYAIGILIMFFIGNATRWENLAVIGSVLFATLVTGTLFWVSVK